MERLDAAFERLVPAGRHHAPRPRLAGVLVAILVARIDLFLVALRRVDCNQRSRSTLEPR